MKEDIGFHIGKEVSPLDKPPFRAYFHWTNDGQIVKCEDFPKQELEREIASGQREVVNSISSEKRSVALPSCRHEG